MSLSDWKKEFEGKKILIWGYGMEGKSSYAFIRSLLPEQEIDIAAGRNGKTSLEKAEKDTIHTRIFFDNEIDLSSYDLILKSPGIVVPEGTDLSNISGEAQLFLKHYRDHTIGITGTKGKSTTTSLVYSVLKEAYPVQLVGNIGRACFDAVPEMEKGSLAAFEISCHQLEYCPYSPHIAVYLNLYEEHLDHYGTLEKYGAAKANIFHHQKEGDTAILWKDLPYLKEVKHPLILGRDIYATGHELHVPGHVIKVKDCALIGEHNYSNLAVAYEIGILYGVTDAQFLHACAQFHPLPNRLQDLGEYEGIRFVNDSISTIGQSCIKALESLQNVDTVLIGGMDRGIEYHELEDYLCAHPDLHAVFMYATGRRIYEELKESARLTDHMHLCNDLKEAVETARKLTRRHHICLLSPAASSYDHFKNFEERGACFEKLAFRR